MQRITKVRCNNEVRKEKRKMNISITSFEVESRTYKFKKPLMLETEYVEGGICLTHKSLSLSACGKSLSECEQIIREELAMLWEEYALAPDDELTAGAIVLKNTLLGTVEGAK